MNQTFGPDQTDPSNAIFMPRGAGPGQAPARHLHRWDRGTQRERGRRARPRSGAVARSMIATTTAWPGGRGPSRSRLGLRASSAAGVCEMPSNTPASRIESGRAPAWPLAGLPTVSCRRTQHNPEVERDLSVAATGRPGTGTVVGADQQKCGGGTLDHPRTRQCGRARQRGATARERGRRA
jgi:hypothetical protein